MEQGTDGDGVPVDHDKASLRIDHNERALLFALGWFLGHSIRVGGPFARLRLKALTDGIGQGLEKRGKHDR